MNDKAKSSLAIVVVVSLVLAYYFLLMPQVTKWMNKGKTPVPTVSPSVSASLSPTPSFSAEPVPSGEATPTPVPSATPVPTPVQPTPPPFDPSTAQKVSLTSELLDVAFTAHTGGIEYITFRTPSEELSKEGYRPYGSPVNHDVPMSILAPLSKGVPSFRLLFNPSENPSDLAGLVPDGALYEIVTYPDNPLKVSFTARVNGLDVKRTYELSPNTYDISLTLEFTNPTDAPVTLNYALTSAAGIVPEGIEDLRKTLEVQRALLNSDGYHSIEEERPDELPENGSFAIFPPEPGKSINWVATSSQFFAVFLNPDDAVDVKGAFARRLTPDRELAASLPTFKAGMLNAEGGVVVSGGQLQPGFTVSHGYKVVTAPKFLEILEKYTEEEYAKTVKLGFFGILARLILSLLNGIYFIVRNYGLAIIVLTLMMQAVLHPLTRKQYVSMHKMQKLQPLLQEAQKRFKKDQKKLGEVTMAIYQRTGVNPLGSCLPLLIQLPIFFALYQAFYSCIELRQATFLWVGDLSGPERIPLGFTASLFGMQISTINVLPILMTAIWFVQQSLTPKPTDPNQQMMYKMMKFMPIIFFFFFYNLPSGLVLYWLVRNLAYVFETLWIKRRIRQDEEDGTYDFGKVTLDKILNEQKVTAKKALKNP